MHQPLTQNLYLYVSGNPLNYVDPSGHSWLGNAWNSVVGAVKSAVKAVSSAVSKVVSTVKNVVNNVIVPAVANVANAVKNTISKAVSHVVNGVQKVIDSIDDAINGAPSSGAKRGESILGTKMDMDVKTLIGRNRLFCSADTQRASNKNNSNNVAAQMILDKAIVMGYAQNWKTVEDILKFIWMIALAEPTFWGEVIAAVITVVVLVVLVGMLAYEVYKLWVASQAEAIAIAAAEAAIPGIAGGFGNLECVEAAAAILAYLAAHGLSGRKIEIRFIGSKNGFIMSKLKGGDAISLNGYHVGVEYNFIVYCNVHPYGLLKQIWIDDFIGLGKKVVT